jgi:hypothetical protein
VTIAPTHLPTISSRKAFRRFLKKENVEIITNQSTNNNYAICEDLKF